MGASNGFELLDKKVKNWIWKKGWQSLRDIQEQSIEPILKAKTDVIISASTAAGKTEAAFLPACSKMCEMDNKGVFILYISPLKALINDQYRRLQSLCEILDVPVTPWHGDISQSLKNKQKINGTIHDAVIKEKSINENLPISEFISDIANNIYPTAVIDDNGKYKGTISKSRLLKVFDEGVDNE